MSAVINKIPFWDLGLLGPFCYSALLTLDLHSQMETVQGDSESQMMDLEIHCVSVTAFPCSGLLCDDLNKPARETKQFA